MHPKEVHKNVGWRYRHVLFDVGDKVKFKTSPDTSEVGTIRKLNPKRAVVDCGTSAWNVPYGVLHHVCDVTNSERFQRTHRLLEVANQARKLMNEHGLQKWSLRFNSARRQLGACNYRKKEIVLSQIGSVHRTPEQTTDVILHEIAHALAGWEAGHGPKWKKIASRIGAIPRACAAEPPELSEKRQSVKETVRIGDTVTFKDRKHQPHKGVVIRKNQKTVTVKVSDGTWRVPYAMLITS